jgi:hypothetical protein
MFMLLVMKKDDKGKKRFCANCGSLIPFNSGCFIFHSNENKYICDKCLQLKER